MVCSPDVQGWWRRMPAARACLAAGRAATSGKRAVCALGATPPAAAEAPSAGKQQD